MKARSRQDRQPMPDGQLVNEILTLIVAGHETTASTLNWTWYLISQHPEVQQKLSNELNTLLKSTFPELDDLPKFGYTQQIINESLRLYPAGWHHPVAVARVNPEWWRPPTTPQPYGGIRLTCLRRVQRLRRGGPEKPCRVALRLAIQGLVAEALPP